MVSSDGLQSWAGSPFSDWGSCGIISSWITCLLLDNLWKGVSYLLVLKVSSQSQSSSILTTSGTSFSHSLQPQPGSCNPLLGPLGQKLGQLGLPLGGAELSAYHSSANLTDSAHIWEPWDPKG